MRKSDKDWVKKYMDLELRQTTGCKTKKDMVRECRICQNLRSTKKMSMTERNGEGLL